MTTDSTLTSSDAAASKTGSSRLLSLDVFRGVTILAMILVNNPGQWGAKYQYLPLEHADWHGWTPTDLIFPFFLFIVGTSLAYSLRKYVAPDGSPETNLHARRVDAAVYWRIVRRTALLIFLGWFPGLLFRAIGYASGETNALDFTTFRLPGVLVRIGLVYCCASLIVLHVSLRGQVVLGLVMLLAYWGLLAWLPDPQNYDANLSRDANLVGLIDRTLIGESHMYRAGGRTDPEGLLSTLPAIVTSLLGYWTGLFIQRRGLNYRMVALLAVFGLVCAAIGQGWHLSFPINKKIWTSSYVLLSGGLAMIALAGCLLKFDIWGWRRLGRPFEVVGTNAIFVFVASGIVATALSRWTIGDMTAKNWLFNHLFTSWINDPKLASLAMALATVAFWWLVCWIMSRFGWSIRV